MSPDPLAVNMAVWEIRKALTAEPQHYILVHCTHGYNRSGQQKHGWCGTGLSTLWWRWSTLGPSTSLERCAPRVLHTILNAWAEARGLPLCCRTCRIQPCVLIHCVTGFIIICAMMRLLADQGICVERCIRRFREQRPPGIYKDGYIKDLFR